MRELPLLKRTELRMRGRRRWWLWWAGGGGRDESGEREGKGGGKVEVSTPYILWLSDDDYDLGDGDDNDGNNPLSF